MLDHGMKAGCMMGGGRMDGQDVPGGDWLMTTRRWEKVMIQGEMFETGVRAGGWEVGSTVIRRLARKVGWPSLAEDGAAYISAGLGDRTVTSYPWSPHARTHSPSYSSSERVCWRAQNTSDIPDRTNSFTTLVATENVQRCSMHSTCVFVRSSIGTSRALPPPPCRFAGMPRERTYGQVCDPPPNARRRIVQIPQF